MIDENKDAIENNDAIQSQKGDTQCCFVSFDTDSCKNKTKKTKKMRNLRRIKARECEIKKRDWKMEREI